MRYLFSIISVFVITFSCTKEEFTRNTGKPYSFSLIHPNNNQVLGLEGVHFIWKNIIETPIHSNTSNEQFFVPAFHLQLSTVSNFSSVLIDTLVYDTSFFYSNTLKMSQIYYWKVIEQNSRIEKVDSFISRDYLSKWEGNYPIKVNKRTWSIGYSADTSFQSSIFLQKLTPQKISIKGTDLSLNYNYEQAHLVKEDSMIYFKKFGHNAVTGLSINFINGQFWAYRIDRNGVGGGTSISIRTFP